MLQANYLENQMTACSDQAKFPVDTSQMINRCIASLILPTQRMEETSLLFFERCRKKMEYNSQNTSASWRIRELYWLRYDICHNHQSPWRRYLLAELTKVLHMDKLISTFRRHKLQHRNCDDILPRKCPCGRLRVGNFYQNYNDICHYRKYDRYPN